MSPYVHCHSERFSCEESDVQPRSGARMQPTAQAVGDRKQQPSPEGAKEPVAYTVPKLKDYSAKTLDKAAEKLLAALEQESKAIKTEADWKTFRDRWLARKDGVLTQINELWLKAAPKEAKREVGQRVNKLKVAWSKRCRSRVQGSLDRSCWSLETHGRPHRHHPPRHAPPARRRASRHQNDERNSLCLPQFRLFGPRRSGD